MRAATTGSTLHGPSLWAARAAWAATAAATLGLLVVLLPVNGRAIIADWQVQESYLAVAAFLPQGVYAQYVLGLRYLVLAAYLGVAGLIAWRRPADGMALLASAALLTLPLGFGLGGDLQYGFYPEPAWWPAARAAGRFLSLASTSYLLPALFFLFPNGRFVPGWLAWVAGLVTLPITVGLVALWRDDDSVWGLWIGSLLATLLMALAGQLYRYQRVSDAVERGQTRWVLAALAALPLSVLLTFLLSLLIGPVNTRIQAQLGFLGLHLQLLVMLAIPVSLGLAVLRRGLWGVDPLLNRALVLGGLSAALLVLYLVVVFGLGAFLGLTDNPLLAVAATALYAALVGPLRQRLQNAANRLMYGERDDPATVLARLGQRLESALAPEAVLSTIVETVAQALKLPYVAIAGPPAAPGDPAEPDAAGRLLAATGQPVATERLRLPLIHQSQVVGVLLAAARGGETSLTAADRRLLESLARQAAPAVHAYQLTAALRQSRERIVAAREEERRRLRRDLHDGLGPTLASQALKLDAALDLLEPEPAKAAAYLREVKAQTQATVADIRRLVYELRPAALDELGLASALREHARQMTGPAGGLRVTVAAPEALPPLPAAVEVAAYRISLEALTNVVKHAQARECRVTLTVVQQRGGRSLALEVADDGVGLPDGGPAGVGLASMRERAEDLGGACVVGAGPAGGVRVQAYLPIPEVARP
ncbi:MAG: GAF domain-containing sensor histidine kinase [Anaerolineales bacterium]|nr:GAF domain-containing sensor histidine kinase [Anaerolineales bacterium]